MAQGPGVDKNGAEEVDPGVDGVLANRADVRGRGGFVDRLELVDGAVDGRGGGVWAEAVADEALRWPGSEARIDCKVPPDRGLRSGWACRDGRAVGSGGGGGVAVDANGAVAAVGAVAAGCLGRRRGYVGGTIGWTG